MDESNQIGVYVILNVVNQKVYVGSTAISFKRRWASHKKMLRAGTHENQYLQRAWTRHGEESFTFFVWTTCENASEVLAAEQHVMDGLAAYERTNGYNIRRTAYNCSGCKRSAEYSAKIKQRMSEWANTPEGKQQMKERAAKFFADKPAVKARGERLSKRYDTDPNLRQRASDLAKKQHSENPRQAEAHSAFQKNRFKDPVVLAQNNAILEKCRTDPEILERRRVNHLKAVNEPAHRKQISDAGKLRWSNPEYRAKMSLAFKERERRRRTSD